MGLDYYPFGMVVPGRSFTSTNYRYGFNDKEKDDEVEGNGNIYNYGARIYNPRLGRFLSVDPLQKKYSWLSVYQFAENSPIEFFDIDGRESGWNVSTSLGGMSTMQPLTAYRQPAVVLLVPVAQFHLPTAEEIKMQPIVSAVAAVKQDPSNALYNPPVEKQPITSAGAAISTAGKAIQLVGIALLPFTDGASAEVIEIGEGVDKGGTAMSIGEDGIKAYKTGDYKDVVIDIGGEVLSTEAGKEIKQAFKSEGKDALKNKAKEAAAKLATDVLAKDPGVEKMKEVFNSGEKKTGGTGEAPVPSFLQPPAAASDATYVAQPH